MARAAPGDRRAARCVAAPRSSSDYYLQHLRRADLYISRMAEHYGLAGLWRRSASSGLAWIPRRSSRRTRTCSATRSPKRCCARRAVPWSTPAGTCAIVRRHGVARLTRHGCRREPGRVQRTCRARCTTQEGCCGLPNRCLRGRAEHFVADAHPRDRRAYRDPDRARRSRAWGRSRVRLGRAGTGGGSIAVAARMISHAAEFGSRSPAYAVAPRPVTRARSGSALKRVARRIARPVLSPIDGRVADINRRVERSGASTESSLEAYAQSASEASSYIGVELRRHQRPAGGVRARRSFEENYKMRLAQACRHAAREAGRLAREGDQLRHEPSGFLRASWSVVQPAGCGRRCRRGLRLRCR